MTARDLTAVVVSYGHCASLPTALASLARVGSGLREVVVVDNAGDLGDGAALRGSPLAPRLLAPGSNLGYAAAANLGAAATAGALLLFLSPDAEVLACDAGALDTALGGRVGAAGALTSDARDRPSVSWGEFPGLRRALRRTTGARRRFDRRALAAVAAGDAVAVPWLVGAAVVVPRAVFERLGGFDPAYPVAGEDQDFGRRLELAGLRSIVSPAWRVRHQPRAAATLMAAIRSNERRFLARHGSRLDRLLWTLVPGARSR